MITNRDREHKRLYQEPGEEKLSQFEQGAWTAIKNFIAGRRELAMVVVLGTVLILSILFLLICLRAMIPVDGIYDQSGVRVGHDFIAFYSSAIFAQGGDAVLAYDPEALSALQKEILGVKPENLPWRYPPVYFFFLLPFASLSYLGAFWAWTAFTVLALMVVVRRIFPVWYAPLLVPLCLPVAYSMVAGQNGILTAILLGAGIFMLPRSNWIAGIFFGLLVCKPQLAVAVPFCLLAGRYYSAFISMSATAIILIIASYFIFGIDSWIAFFEGLSSQGNSLFSAKLEVWERIPTIIITALQLFESSRIAWIVQVFSATLAITIAAWVWRTSNRQGTLALALIASIPLSSPYVWDYDIAILIVPIAFLASDAWKHNWDTGRFLLLSSMWVAEPMLRIISEKVDLQVGPAYWIILLLYSAFLAKQERDKKLASSRMGKTRFIRISAK